jgi:hypothetical protein
MALVKGVSLTALITAGIGYWRYPESRCITLFPDKGHTVTTGDEVQWRDEFAKTGATQVRENLSNPAIYNSVPKRNFALQWLRDKECASELREQETYRYVRRTFWAAIAAVLVGIIGIVATLLR